MSEAVYTLREFVAHSKDVSSVALSRHTKQILASGGTDYKINLWRLDSANCQMTMSGHDSAVQSLAFHSMCSKLCGGSSKGVVKIWDLQSAALTHTFTSHKKSIKSLEFHAFGDFLATGCADCTVKLWDLRRKGCIMTYKGHQSTVNAVKFSPDGRWLASADAGGIVKIWDMSTHQLLQQFEEHQNNITSLDFHPAELLMATSSSDDTLKIWDLDEMKLLGSLQVQQPRVVLFGSNHDHLFCIGDKELHVCGWEPQVSQTSVKLKHAGTNHAVFSEDLLMGAAFEENQVSAYAVNVKTISIKLKLEKNNLNKSRKTFVGPISEIISKHTDDNKAGGDDIKNDVEVKDEEFMDFISKDKVVKLSAEQFDSDLRILTEVRNSHKSVLEHLNKQQCNLQEIKKEWTSKGVKSAVSLAINKQDDSIIVDLLHVLLSDVRLWNLDVCLLLLPVLWDLMQSNVEKHFHIGLSTLRLIGHTFGPLIKTNISLPPHQNENDFARQERHYKCKSCYKHLSQIHNFLRRKKIAVQQGRLGEKIREMHDLIGRIVL